LQQNGVPYRVNTIADTAMEFIPSKSGAGAAPVPTPPPASTGLFTINWTYVGLGGAGLAALVYLTRD
jgi:hypothetical protein